MNQSPYQQPLHLSATTDDNTSPSEDHCERRSLPSPTSSAADLWDRFKNNTLEDTEEAARRELNHDYLRRVIRCSNAIRYLSASCVILLATLIILAAFKLDRVLNKGFLYIQFAMSTHVLAIFFLTLVTAAMALSAILIQKINKRASYANIKTEELAKINDQILQHRPKITQGIQFGVCGTMLVIAITALCLEVAQLLSVLGLLRQSSLLFEIEIFASVLIPTLLLCGTSIIYIAVESVSLDYSTYINNYTSLIDSEKAVIHEDNYDLTHFHQWQEVRHVMEEASQPFSLRRESVDISASRLPSFSTHRRGSLPSQPAPLEHHNPHQDLHADGHSRRHILPRQVMEADKDAFQGRISNASDSAGQALHTEGATGFTCNPHTHQDLHTMYQQQMPKRSHTHHSQTLPRIRSSVKTTDLDASSGSENEPGTSARQSFSSPGTSDDDDMQPVTRTRSKKVGSAGHNPRRKVGHYNDDDINEGLEGELPLHLQIYNSQNQHRPAAQLKRVTQLTGDGDAMGVAPTTATHK